MEAMIILIVIIAALLGITIFLPFFFGGDFSSEEEAEADAEDEDGEVFDFLETF